LNQVSREFSVASGVHSVTELPLHRPRLDFLGKKTNDRMSSRNDILSAIRSHPLEATPLPTLEQDWIKFDDPVAHFGEVLATVGGRCIPVATLGDINRELSNLPEFSTAIVRVSTVDGVGSPTQDLDAITDPHELESVDFAVLPGEFAVAENGAVWVTDAQLKHRVPFFLSQHLALVVPASEVLNNMHDAYERLSFGEPRFGAFISGPSKTADIEQSLVIGAHGPRSHIVFLVDELSPTSDQSR